MFNEGGRPLHNVLYRGGGKGGSPAPAPPPTYQDPTTGMTFSSPDALNAEIQQRTQAATDAANLKATQDAATATANENTFQTNKTQAYNDAMNQVLQTFKGQGLDPNQYMSYITPAMQQAQNSIPDLSTNIASYFPTSMGQTILNQATGDYRTGLTNQLNQTFNPMYSTNAVPTSTMDPAIQSILSSQFDPLSAELQNAQKRGTLTDTGYQAALAKMNQDKAAAQSQLQTLGQNILTGDRSALDTMISGARSDIANANLGSNLDPSQYVGQAGQMAAQDVSGFQGALQSAAGNTTFADIQDLLNAGGSVQGANNPTAANPNAIAGAAGAGTGAIGAGGGAPGAAGAVDPTAQQTQNRGLGTTGSF